MGILLLLALWCLSPLAGLLPIQFRDHADHSPSEVEANRIQAAAAPAPVCHHHPEGCPADCHCPKVVPEHPGHGDAVAAAGSLAEPSLVQCTEGKAKANHPPALIAFWLPGSEVPAVGIASRPAWPAGSEAPLDPSRDPPRHVPRTLPAPA